MVDNIQVSDISTVKRQGTDGNEIELSLLCRVCASPNEHLIPIFEGEGKENELAEKIHSYLPIKVSPKDDYPDHICYPCASTLVAFHDLVKCCEESKVKLKQRIDNGESRHKKIKLVPAESPGKNKKPERLLHGRCLPDVTERSTKGNKLATARAQRELRTNSLKQSNVTEKGQSTITNPHICSFCAQSFKDSDVLTNHLLDSHADLLFRCDVCGLYLDRKELIPHMSKHAEQYNENLLKKENVISSKQPNNTTTSCSKQQSTNKKTEDLKTVPQNSTTNEADAFSSTSRSNDGFGPLPESVFEAIKDPEETAETTKTVETKVEEAPKATQSQNNCETEDKIKKNSEPNKIICPICSKEFRLASSYHYHKKHYHGGLKEHVCNVCGRSFAVKSALKEHGSIHLGTKPYSCPQCSKEFRTKASVYIHYKNIHCETKQFPCTMCNRSFRWKQKLLRHISSHTKEKKYFCPKCNKGFGVKYDLTRHMKSHVESKAYSCDKCDRPFSQLRYLKKHVKTKHSTAPPEIQQQANITYQESGTNISDKKTPASANLTTSTINNINVCILNGTQIKELLNDAFKVLTCHMCSENFLNLEELQEHIKSCIHYVCEACHLSFEDCEELDKHQTNCNIHHCNTCPKRFISAPTLRAHQVGKHSTFTCDFCPAKFINDLECETHKTDNKHCFLCEECNKTFDSSLVAVKHRLNNVPGDKLLCSLCYGSFQYLPKIKREIITEDVTIDNTSLAMSTEDTYILPHLEDEGKPNQQLKVVEKYVCLQCDNVYFDSISELNNHVKQCHTNPFLEEGSNQTGTALDKYEKQIDALFDTKILQSDFEKQSVYTCVVCSKVYKSFSTYCRHVYHFHRMNLLLGSSKKYHCHECRVDKNKLSELNNHLYSRHENSMPCEHCTQTFSSKKDLKMHILKNHPSEPAFSCIDCTLKFHTQAELKKHCLWHWYQEIVECTACNKKIRGKKKMKEHMRYHVTQNVDGTNDLGCEECGKTFSSKSSLQGHMRNVHSDRKKETILCGDCGMLVSCRRFKRHYDRMHTKGRVFLCTLCPRSFFCKELLRQHSDTHVVGRPHECTMCPAAFKQQRNLRMHIRNFHSAPTNTCKLCNIKFETPEECAEHKEQNHKNSAKFIKLESGDGYQCAHCSKVVKTSRAMAGHMRMMHEEHMSLKCSQCDQKFAFLRQLQNHMGVHSGPKPDLSCNNCGKMFTTLGSLNSHIKWVHIGERNFQCSYCPSRFKRKDAQIVHERTHTDERPYTCTICDRKFRQRTDCKRHEAKHNMPGFKYNRPHRVRPKESVENRTSAGEVVIEEVVEGVEEEQMDTSDTLMLLEVPTQEDHQAAAFLSYIVQN